MSLSDCVCDCSTGLLFDGEFLGSGAGKGKIVTLSSHDRELVFEGEWRSSLPFGACSPCFCVPTFCFHRNCR